MTTSGRSSRPAEDDTKNARLLNRRDLIAASGTGAAAVLLSSALPGQAHGNQVSSPESDFIIDQAMQNGWWDGNRYIYYFAADDRATAMTDLRTGLHSFTEELGPVEHVPSRGVRSTGGKLRLTSTPAELGVDPNDCMMCVVCESNEPEVAQQIGCFGGGFYWMLRAWDGLRSGGWPVTSTQLTFRGTRAFGITMTVRTSSAGGFHVKDGVVTSWTAPSVPLPANDVRAVGAGSSATPSKNRLLAVVFGSPGVTEAQAQNIVDTFNQVFGMLGIEPPPPVDPGPNYFTRAMLDQVAQSGLEAVGLGPLAANDSVTEATYDYFPFATLSNRPWGSGKTANNSYQTPLEFFWGDRATGPAPGVKTAWAQRPNDISGIIVNSAGVECRVEYDTYEKAIAATVGRAMWTLGYQPLDDPIGPGGKGYLQVLGDAGFDTSPWLDVLDDPNLLNNDTSWDGGDLVHHRYALDTKDTFFDTPASAGGMVVAVNKVILGQGRQVDTTMPYAGMLLDMEWADDRGDALCVQTLTRLGQVLHAKGKQLYATIHALDSGAAAHSGVDKDTFWQVVPHVDAIGLMANANPVGGDTSPSLTSQKAMLAGTDGTRPVPASTLLVQVNIGPPGSEISLAQTQEARDWMLAEGIDTLLVGRAGAAAGGDINQHPNKVIATACGLPF